MSNGRHKDLMVRDLQIRGPFLLAEAESFTKETILIHEVQRHSQEERLERVFPTPPV